MLTDDDKKALRAAALTANVSPEQLIAAAETLDDKPGEPAPPRDAGKLYMYLLPFVTVREVREHFLGIADGFPGDSAIAADWARAHPVASPTDSKPGGPQDPEDAT